MVDQQELKHFGDRLKKMEKEDREASEAVTEKLRTPLSETLDELSLYDNHPADIGDETFEREKDLGFRLYWEDRLAMIKGAQESIKKGTYGICEACGRKIDSERLEAVPYTNLCRDCKKDHEELEHHPRPIEEDIISPPFGAKTDDNNAFDGEDSWQAVARYGTSDTPSDLWNGVDNYNQAYEDSDEEVGIVEEFEKIPAEKDKDGMIYQDFDGENE